MSLLLLLLLLDGICHSSLTICGFWVTYCVVCLWEDSLTINTPINTIKLTNSTHLISWIHKQRCKNSNSYEQLGSMHMDSWNACSVVDISSYFFLCPLFSLWLYFNTFKVIWLGHNGLHSELQQHLRVMISH